MANTRKPAPALPKLPGIIDTLSAGFQTVNRHLYLLLVPILLDLFYWLGPRLTVKPARASTALATRRASASPLSSRSNHCGC